MAVVNTNVAGKSLAKMTPGSGDSSWLLEGATMWLNGQQINGAMPNKGAWSQTITPSASEQTIAVPYGYHNGAGQIKVGAIAGGGQTIRVVRTGNNDEYNFDFNIASKSKVHICISLNQARGSFIIYGYTSSGYAKIHEASYANSHDSLGMTFDFTGSYSKFRVYVKRDEIYYTECVMSVTLSAI